MLPIALIYGAIAGLISIGTIIATIVISGMAAPGSEWLGYLIMIIAMSLIFFGVKRHRDRDLGGVIRFVPALLAGLAIAAIASIIYVIVWDIYQAATGYAFIHDYAAAYLEQKQAEGMSAEALEAERLMLDELVARYANPLFRLPVTFSEIFPVGLIIALISAALLRNPKFAPAKA